MNVVDAINNKKMLELAQAMVRIPSPRWKESELARYLANYMEGAGFEVERLPVKFAGYETEQVVARVRGTGRGKSLLLCGHLDTAVWESDVYREDKWTVAPHAGTVKDGKLFGNGSMNMKGQVAAAIAAGEAVIKSGVKLDGDLIIAAVAVETSGGIGAQQLMEHGIRADYGIVVEPSDMEVVNTFTVASRGRIRFEGRVKHAGVKTAAIDPLVMATQTIAAFGEQHVKIPSGGWLTYKDDPDFPDYPQYRVVSLEMVSDFCDLVYDIRIIPGQSDETVAKDIGAVLGKLGKENKEFKATLITPPSEEYSSRPQTPKVDSGTAIIQAIDRAHRAEYGASVYVGPRARWGFADDAAHLRAAGMEAVTYGPGLEEPWPMIDEAVEVKSLEEATRIFARVIVGVCGTD